MGGILNVYVPNVYISASMQKGGQQLQSTPKPRIDVLSATKTATTTLDFSVISDAATTQQEINKIRNKNKNIRMYHPC